MLSSKMQYSGLYKVAELSLSLSLSLSVYLLLITTVHSDYIQIRITLLS
ncbi:MAG: hypothetical protein K7J15_03935 [Candidatus Regiella insecticola]|nr:hypothetical protein [Candidatus Regiella insecticola]